MVSITDVVNDMKSNVDEILDDESVIVYSSTDFDLMAQADSRLRSDDGFVAIMYAGMASNNAAQGGVSTLGRFVILVSFKEDRARIKGLEDPVNTLSFMTKVRQALAKKRAPNNQMYKFVSEAPITFESKGDGYSQQWTVPLTVDA